MDVSEYNGRNEALVRAIERKVDTRRHFQLCNWLRRRDGLH
jgi:hypothetical protein